MKGSAWAWLVILMAIFATGLIYVIFTEPFYTLIGAVEGRLPNITYPNGTAINTTQAQTTLDYIKTAWNWWPLIAIIGFIIVGFILAQKREPDYGYY